MSPVNVNLSDLITGLDSELPGGDDLAKISEAQRRSHTLADLGEALVGHYVSQAKNAGASWSQIGEAIGVTKQAAQQRWVPALFERYTNRARHVVVLAQERARGLHHGYIGTEHLLLGLLGEPDALAGQILVELAGSAEAVETAVAAAIQPGTGTSPNKIPFTRPGKQVLEMSGRSAAGMEVDFVGTEHLLLGVLAVPDGTGAVVLDGLGVTAELVRPKVVEKLAGYVARLKADSGED